MSAGAGLFWLMVTLQCLAAAAVVPALQALPADTTGLIHPDPQPTALRDDVVTDSSPHP